MNQTEPPGGRNGALCTSYRVSVFLLLAAACLVRLAFLDMDPHYYQWVGYVTDEGRWTEHARAAALGSAISERPVHLILAPLYQLLSFASFKAFGVSLVSARLTSALAGCGLVIGMFFLLRRFVSKTAALVAVSLVAFHADFVMLSRIAIPEMPAMAGSLAAFAILISDWPRRSRLLAVGLVIGATVAIKATTVPLIGIFAVMAFFDRTHGAGIATRLGNAMWMVAPIAIVTGLALAVGVGFWPSETSAFSVLIQHFIGVRSLFDAIDVLYSSPVAPVLCFAGLGAWVGVIGLLAGRPDLEDPRRRLAAAAGLWGGLYLLLILVQEYFPDRYIAHILTPLTLMTAVGIDLLLERGLVGLPAALARTARGRGLPAIALLGLPSAILIAPTVVAAAVSLGVELRLRLVLLAVVAAWLVTLPVISRYRDRAGLLRGLVVVPIVGAGLWFGGWAISQSHYAFWPDGTGSFAATWRMVFVLSAAVLLATSSRGTPSTRAGLVAASCVALWLVHLAPAYLDRHYTMRDTSREIGERFGRYALSEHASEGLFLENEIPIRRLGDTWRKLPLPERIVVGFRFRNPDFLRAHYEPEAHYDLYFAPACTSLPAIRWEENCCTPDGHNFTVYRLRDRS